MSINKKIVSLILISFLFVAIVFTFDSVNSLRKSQTDNLRLFKAEFLELARESFENSSYQFFYNLDSEASLVGDKEIAREKILSFIKKNDPSNQNTLIVNIDDKNVLKEYSSSALLSIYDTDEINSLIKKYLTENTLNQKSDFDLDNFTEFSADQTNKVVPKKIHFRIYENAGLMVGNGYEFLSVKTRLGFIERQNKDLFNRQIYYSLFIFATVFLLTVFVLIVFLRKIFLLPLGKVVEVVKVITAGDLTKKIEIKSKDEIGELGVAFNGMTTKLKESYEILESKIAERTKELQDERGSLEKKVEERTSELEGLKNSLEKTVEERTQNLNSKVLELERMNDLMVGREIKMAELKKEIKELKDKKNKA